MEVNISRGDHALLLNWADDAAPEECCGLIFGRDGSVSRCELTSNVAEDPTGFFEIDPARLIAAEKSSREGPGEGKAQLIGYFHSHPNGRTDPSPYDAKMAAADGRLWLIIAVGQVTAWEYDENSGFSSVKLNVGA